MKFWGVVTEKEEDSRKRNVYIEFSRLNLKLVPARSREIDQRSKHLKELQDAQATSLKS